LNCAILLHISVLPSDVLAFVFWLSFTTKRSVTGFVTRARARNEWTRELSIAPYLAELNIVVYYYCCCYSHYYRQWLLFRQDCTILIQWTRHSQLYTCRQPDDSRAHWHAIRRQFTDGFDRNEPCSQRHEDSVRWWSTLSRAYVVLTWTSEPLLQCRTKRRIMGL